MNPSERLKRLARSILSVLVPDFWGEITIKAQAGKIVLVRVTRDQKPDEGVEVIDLFKSILIK